MKKRVVSILLVAVMAAVAMAGCGNSSKDASDKKETVKPTDAQTGAVSDKEETEKSTDAEAGAVSDRTVVIATAGSGEPYSLIADDGTWTGIDAEIWAEIEKRTGWTIELKQAAFDAVWGELDTGRADVCANCWAVKPERTEKYNASIPYYGDAQCIIVSDANEDIYEFADLAGKTVGCTNGQAAQTIIEEMAEEIGFTVTLYEDSSVGMNDLNLGRVDAYANTTTNVNNFTHYNDGISFRFLEEDLTANNVAYFLSKTDEGAALCQELDAVLQEMIDDGTIGAITEKWMFADMTKLIQK